MEQKKKLNNRQIHENLKYKQKQKIKAAIYLKSVLPIENKEQRLWYEVLKRAIRDIGAWKKDKDYKNGVCRTRFNIPHYNSDRYFNLKNMDFKILCLHLKTEPDFIIKTLKHYGLIPVKRDYYDRVREELGL